MVQVIQKWNRLNAYPPPFLCTNWSPRRSYAMATQNGNSVKQRTITREQPITPHTNAFSISSPDTNTIQMRKPPPTPFLTKRLTSEVGEQSMAIESLAPAVTRTQSETHKNDGSKGTHDIEITREDQDPSLIPRKRLESGDTMEEVWITVELRRATKARRRNEDDENPHLLLQKVHFKLLNAYS